MIEEDPVDLPEQLITMHTFYRFTILLYFLVFSIFSAFAQDSLVFKNGNRMNGEIKKMDRGVLTIETDYSKSDFTIEWKGIQGIYTRDHFLITLSDGSRLVGSLQSDSTTVTIHDETGTTHDYPSYFIVTLKSLKDKFWDNVYASLSLGYSLTKAQALQQFTSRSTMGYVSEHWAADLSYNNLRSTQDDVEDVRREDGGLTFSYFLPKDWYIPASVTFLSNTEQKIDIRLLSKVGIGKYLIHRNKAYWGFSLGANANYEVYSDESEGGTSWEGFIGTEVNLFDVGDLSLLTRAVAYPSLTESGRVRADFVFDFKYDLPLDFFIQLGLTVNFDNKPVEGTPDTDYVFQTTFGWSWN